MRTNLNGNDKGTKNGTTKQSYRTGIPPKETTATAKEWPNFLVEIQKILTGRKYSGTPAKQPTYYVNYKKEEDRVNALIGLIHKEWQGWQPQRRKIST